MEFDSPHTTLNVPDPTLHRSSQGHRVHTRGRGLRAKAKGGPRRVGGREQKGVCEVPCVSSRRSGIKNRIPPS